MNESVLEIFGPVRRVAGAWKPASQHLSGRDIAQQYLGSSAVCWSCGVSHLTASAPKLPVIEDLIGFEGAEDMAISIEEESLRNRVWDIACVARPGIRVHDQPANSPAIGRDLW